MKFEKYIGEASASQAVDRGNELHDLLMNSDILEKLKDAGMKTQKEASRLFQQTIQLLRGLGKETRQFKKVPKRR
jgi:hypothetical protein